MPADRNLLFGLLALQNGLIDQGQLVAAFQAWSLDKECDLADRLVARGDLDSEDRSAVDALVARHLKKHGGEVERSLASIPVGRSTRESLAALPDRDIEQTVNLLAVHSDDDADRTTTYSVGMATSEGQRFRVLRPYARGGLGAVFVALDTELHREVALKQILDRHADDPASRQRFLVEAEITGGLEHPGIVPVYGLGTYGEGRPYYAMRFVRGDSLKEAIAAFHGAGGPKADPGRRSLELRKLLRRFMDVCNAIDYAHSRGVLHRDIKPGNIIVGKHGETLVVDWGLAKLRGRTELAATADERPLVPRSASGSSETLPGSALGTPAYMSPEQARGELEQLGPASDVYSLGATLYCLLTGRPPVEADDIGAVLRAVQQAQFPPPRQVDPGIDQALEAVCLKAMALQPDDRYATPKGLADDVERWMADEPVVAWREPLARRARRWMRQHQTTVTSLAATVLVSVVGLTAVLLVQARANRELSASNERERKRFDLAVEAVRKFHTGVSEDVLLKQAEFQELRTRLLRDAQSFYRKLGGLVEGRTDRRSRAALANAHYEVAELTSRIGDPEEALAELRRAIGAWRGLAAEPGAGPEARVGIARGLAELGQLELEMGRGGESRFAYEEARSLLEGVDHAGHSTAEVRSLLASLLYSLATTVYFIQDAPRARNYLERARVLQQRLVADDPARDQYRADLALTDAGLGSVLFLDTSEAGQAAWARAREELERLIRDHPNVALYRERLLWTCITSGSYSRRDDAARALAWHDRAVALGEQLVQASPAVHRYWSALAAAHRERGYDLTEAGRNEDAKAAQARELDIRERLARVYPDDVRYASSLTWHLVGQAAGPGQGDDPAEALGALEHARAIAERMVKARPDVAMARTDLAVTLKSIAELKIKAGKVPEAIADFKSACALYRANLAAAPADTLNQTNLAGAEYAFGTRMAEVGLTTEAVAAYQRAADVYEELIARDEGASAYLYNLAQTCQNVGQLQSDQGRFDEARASYLRAIDLRTRLIHEQRDDASAECNLSISEQQLGDLDAQRGRAEQALAEYRKARVPLESLMRERPKERFRQLELAKASIALGRRLAANNWKDEAREPLEWAEALLERLPESEMSGVGDLSELAVACYSLSAGLGELGRDPRGVAKRELLYQRAVSIFDSLVRKFPASSSYRDNLAWSLSGLGLLLAEAHRGADAIPLYDRALAVVEELMRQSPDILTRANLTAGIHNNRGLALAALGRHAEALDDYRKAIVIEQRCLGNAPGNDLYRSWLGFHHRNLGKSLRALGRLDESYAAALAGHQLRPERPESIYDYACDLAVLSGLIGKGRAQLTQAERHQQADWADRSVAELRRAIDAGFRDIALITRDPDLASIRSRADFRDVLIHTIFQVDPFAS